MLKKQIGGAFQPEFSSPISNLTIPLGRDATFTCLVEHLGGYRVSIFVNNKIFWHTHILQVITYFKNIMLYNQNKNITSFVGEEFFLFPCEI